MKIIGRFGDIYGGIDAGDWTIKAVIDMCLNKT